MSTGQTLLSIGVLVVVTIMVINAHRWIIESETNKLQGMALIEAADISEELISEVLAKKFDEYEVTTSYQSTSAFTSVSALGPESGETFILPDTLPYRSRARYDDFDDYNNYQRTVNTELIRGYTVSCRVYYATNTAPNTPQTSKQYVKTIEVSVTHPAYIPRPLKISATKVY